MSDDDRAGEFGPIYLPALQRIRDCWLELEPLVDATAYDDVVAPTELQISLTGGLGDAESARLDIQWSELGMYSFHYVDSDEVNWRFDRHPNTHSPEIHFHPPPEAATTAVEPSCIDVTEVSLVTRAVHAMWRAAYEADDMEQLNSVSNRRETPLAYRSATHVDQLLASGFNPDPAINPPVKRGPTPARRARWRRARW